MTTSPRRPSSRRALLALAGAALAVPALAAPGAAVAALPAVAVGVVTQSMDDVSANFHGTTISTSCAGGKLVSGGAFLRAISPPTTAPNGTNGLVLGGTFPSANGTPYDPPVTNGTVDPTFWGAIANFTGQAETGDQRNVFAMCATAEAPSHIQVVSATSTGANPNENAAPALTTATCPGGTSLVGGGAQSDPSQTAPTTPPMGPAFRAFGGNTKPAGDFPSDASGVPASDGATNPTSWSAFGNGPNNVAATDKITAFALCSTDTTFNANHTIQVARADVAGPGSAAPSAPIVTNHVTCPSATRLLGGGYRYDQGTTGAEPNIGYHARGSYPSDASGAPVSDGTTNPDTWSAAVQGGGGGGTNPNLKTFALCAQDNTPPPPVTPTLTTTASGTVALGGSISDQATLVGGSAPTGNITFALYNQSDAMCASPIASAGGSVPVDSGNGTYTSPSFTPATAGVYKWVAGYDGDAANTAVTGSCTDPAEVVTVTSSSAPPTTPTCAVTATRLSGAPHEQDVTIDGNGNDLVTIGNVAISNGTVHLGNDAGARIDDAGTTTLPSGLSSLTLTAVQGHPGTTVWSFDVTNANALGATHCA